MEGGTFAANLTRVGEKDNYDYLVRWVHNARERTRPYCPLEKKDIGPEDYKKKGLPYVFDLEHSRCPNDGHELQVQNMTVMPSLRLSPQDAEDVASYLIALDRKSTRLNSSHLGISYAVSPPILHPFTTRRSSDLYCPLEKKDIGPEDYKKKGLPYVFDLEHSRCPNDGHELQVQNMTVMPSLRLSPQDAEDVASYLIA